ncbi:MAG: MFS transporter, partial [Candidatus Bathyarchaeota archaeon]
FASAQDLVVRAAYFVSIIGSSLVGSTFSNRIRRINLLCLWILLGVVASLLSILLGNSTVAHGLFVSVLLGVSFGLGMPSCLAYFTDCTPIDNRGQTSGIVFLATNLSAPLFAVILNSMLNSFNLIACSLILAVWRGIGLLFFLLKPEEKSASKKGGDISFVSVFHDRSFVLYFVAWLMFCFVDRFERPILTHLFGDFSYLMIGPIIGSFFALVAGVLSDRIGRKRVVLCGFATLGIAYAIIGIAPEAIFSWYFFITLESISTGILWVLFILILWGDLSRSGTGEKYYAIGAIPYFLTFIVQQLSGPSVATSQQYLPFFVASFFLFLGVFPLTYAPETLSEKKIELRRLRKYVEKAKIVKEKHIREVVQD